MRASDGDVSEDHGDGDLAEGVTRHGVRRWCWLHRNKCHTTDTVANQCCSSANWVLVEVLERGYGHSFGIWGLGHGPLRPSP